MQNERTNEHDPLIGVCTIQERESIGGEQGEVNGNNRQFFLFLSFHSLASCFFVFFTKSDIYTLSLLGQTTIEIDDDHQPVGHLITYTHH
jgi:hypothetical protein